MVKDWELAIAVAFAALISAVGSFLCSRRAKFSKLRLLLAVSIITLFFTGLIACWDWALTMLFPEYGPPSQIRAWLIGTYLGLVVVINLLFLTNYKFKCKSTAWFTRFLKWQYKDNSAR
jgi:hypothetical protein